MQSEISLSGLSGQLYLPPVCFIIPNIWSFPCNSNHKIPSPLYEAIQSPCELNPQTAELERRIALESVQKELDDEETAVEADQIRGQTDQAVGR